MKSPEVDIDLTHKTKTCSQIYVIDFLDNTKMWKFNFNFTHLGGYSLPLV